MHIPDGFLNNNLAAGLFAGALGMLGFCLSKVFRTVTASIGVLAGNNSNGNIGSFAFKFPDNAGKYFQKMAIAALWIFAFQMFNVPIQSATSAHLIGGLFAAVLAGPFGGFIIISSVLIVQSLFFADGGILALGANILNMAFIGSFLSYYIYKALSGKNYYLAILTACFFSVTTAALFCLIELGISGTVSFTKAFKDMMSLHSVAALLETVITLALLKVFKISAEGKNE
ncbi:energy-coupling factor ABC transporter permease [Candidatus Endomicrobiellum agilis]|uniref:energy-coupling factor ABC transporter permease n=1 Tax=Candidatus Endomicrobiellum agilis TaxID=3238957 RepID=UPI003572BD8D|nr:energy-coupling factor ABC transporter permease [Endomicrobium sp.]